MQFLAIFYDGIFNSLKAKVNMSSIQIEPSVVPELVVLEPANSTALNITLRVPNEYDMNGLITQIGISYRPLSDSSHTDWNFSQQIHGVDHDLFFDGKPNYTTSLIGLSYFTRYEVFLNYSTAVGFGRASFTKINRTSEYGKRITEHICFYREHDYI